MRMRFNAADVDRNLHFLAGQLSWYKLIYESDRISSADAQLFDFSVLVRYGRIV